MFVHLAERPELSFGLQAEYINGGRIYTTPEGNKYSSITTVLGELSKAGIQKWRKRVGEVEANRISTKASRQGTRVHSICESYIKNEYGYLDGRMPHLAEMFSSIQPLLDRIDLHVEVTPVSFDELASKTKGKSSADIRERVWRQEIYKNRDTVTQKGFMQMHK